MLSKPTPLEAAALRWARLRIRESEAAAKSTEGDYSAEFPTRTAIQTAERALLEEAKRWL